MTSSESVLGNPYYWADTSPAVMAALGTNVEGLASGEAAGRVRMFGPNRIVARAELTRWVVFLKQFRNPLLVILIVAAAASGASGEWNDALVVPTVVVATVAVGRRRHRLPPATRSPERVR